jgi:hypothetical protein
MWIKSLDGNPINLTLATNIYVRRSSALESLNAEANKRVADVHLVVEFAAMAGVPNAVAVESPIVRSLSVVYSGSSEACFALRDQLAELVGAVTLEPTNDAVRP